MDNMIPMGQQMAAPKTSQTEMMISRQAQEVQGAIVMAKRFPRDEYAAMERIKRTCQRATLAEQAIYSYPRGGQTVMGPSIRLAEALAQNWGNIDYGVIELEQKNGASEMMAYAWDLESNTRVTKIFTVEHKRDTKKGTYQLTDSRDIYEATANFGARRMRACILGVIPGDVVDMAVGECKETVRKGIGKEPINERVTKLINAFKSEFRVTREQIEKYAERNCADFGEDEFINLKGVYKALKDGQAKAEDYFPIEEEVPIQWEVLQMLLTSENYYSTEADWEYLSVSQYKNFVGSLGRPGCEAYALAKLNEEWIENMEDSDALMVGSYVDAHFEGTLDAFKAQHSCMFKKDGSLMAKYIKANEMINRCERDDLFMAYMSGEKQVIMTAEMFGAKWKIKIDSYIKDKCIVDLKTCQSITKTFYHADVGNMNFLHEWGYYIQGAVYQKVVEINTGRKLPFFIVAVSKEKEPDIQVIACEQSLLDEALAEVESNVPKILALKNNEIDPIRCEQCDYCKHTKVLKVPIWSSDLIGEV